MIRIIADSTCNLSSELLEKYKIQIAPISIQFENETYEEDIDIDRDTFYRKIEEMGIIPTTSQPTPAWFAKFYQEAKPKEDQILVIAITRKHSGTYDSAILAKSMVPEVEVTVFDSASISLGTGWMVLEAARAVEAGQSLESILTRLEHIRANSSLWLTPATLKYLQMSGRVGALQGAIASLLNLRPIIALSDGALAARENVRTRGKSLDRLIALTEQAMGSRPINLGIIHARTPDEGQALLERAKARLNCRETLIADLVASLAVHGGPGVIGIFAYPVE
jgi:DegV family protein with EDD domain